MFNILGRLIYLAGTSLTIYFVGGGSSFVRKPVGMIYLILWNIWWIITFLGRQRGQETKYEQGQKWLVIISGLLSVPYLIVVPVWEYAHFAGPLPREGLMSWLGLVLFVAGILIQSLAMWQLRSFYTVRLGVQSNQKLVTNGLYRRIRHPGYLSYLMSIVGIGLALSSIATLVLVVLIWIFLHFRIKSEEEMLLAEFGDQYRQYMKRTWKLIPFIY